MTVIRNGFRGPLQRRATTGRNGTQSGFMVTQLCFISNGSVLSDICEHFIVGTDA
jgi:hypothetical protein